MVEGLKYDMKQIQAQNDRLLALVQSMANGSPGICGDSTLSTAFDFDLPVKTDAELQQLEDKIQDNAEFKSLVSHLLCYVTCHVIL